MISPCSSTPAATVNGRPLVSGVLIAVVAISRVPAGGTEGGDGGGGGSQGQEALDGGLLDVERGDDVDLVADRLQVARLVLDDQGDEPGLGRALPGDERRLDLGRDVADGVGDEDDVRVARGGLHRLVE